MRATIVWCIVISQIFAMSVAAQIIPYGPPLSLETARRVAAATEDEAKANAWPMVIAVVDSSANLVVLHKMDRAQIGSVAVAQAKAKCAVRFKRPTKVFEEALAAGGLGLAVGDRGRVPARGWNSADRRGTVDWSDWRVRYAVHAGRSGGRSRDQQRDGRSMSCGFAQSLSWIPRKQSG